MTNEFDNLQRLYSDAETALLAANSLGAQFSLPAVNELRYAGHHTLKAITAKNESEKNKQIHRAESHCRRAALDAYELAILYLLENIDGIVLSKRDIAQETESSPKQLSDLLLQVDQARTQYAKLKSGNIYPADEMLAQYGEIFTSLHGAYRGLYVSQPYVREEVKFARLKRKEAITRAIAVFAGLVSLIVAIASMLIRP